MRKKEKLRNFCVKGEQYLKKNETEKEIERKREICKKRCPGDEFESEL